MPSSQNAEACRTLHSDPGNSQHPLGQNAMAIRNHQKQRRLNPAWRAEAVSCAGHSGQRDSRRRFIRLPSPTTPLTPRAWQNGGAPPEVEAKADTETREGEEPVCTHPRGQVQPAPMPGTRHAGGPEG